MWIRADLGFLLNSLGLVPLVLFTWLSHRPIKLILSKLSTLCVIVLPSSPPRNILQAQKACVPFPLHSSLSPQHCYVPTSPKTILFWPLFALDNIHLSLPHQVIVLASIWQLPEFSEKSSSSPPHPTPSSSKILANLTALKLVLLVFLPPHKGEQMGNDLYSVPFISTSWNSLPSLRSHLQGHVFHAAYRDSATVTGYNMLEAIFANGALTILSPEHLISCPTTTTSPLGSRTPKSSVYLDFIFVLN